MPVTLDFHYHLASFARQHPAFKTLLVNHDHDRGRPTTLVLVDRTHIARLWSLLRGPLAVQSASIGIVLPTNRVDVQPADVRLQKEGQDALPTSRVRWSKANTRLPVGLAPVAQLAIGSFYRRPELPRGSSSFVMAVIAAIADATAQYGRQLVQAWERLCSTEGVDSKLRALCSAATDQVRGGHLPQLDAIHECAAMLATRAEQHNHDELEDRELVAAQTVPRLELNLWLHKCSSTVAEMQRLQATVNLLHPGTEDVVVLLVESSTTPHGPSTALHDVFDAMVFVKLFGVKPHGVVRGMPSFLRTDDMAIAAEVRAFLDRVRKVADRMRPHPTSDAAGARPQRRNKREERDRVNV